MKKISNSAKIKIKKAGKILLIFVLVYAVFSMALSSVIFKVIFRRNDEPQMNFEYSYTEFAEKYPRSDVTFKSGKYNLRGYMYRANTAPAGTIVFANGIESDAESHLAEIMFFADNGFNVLIYSNVGTGKSDGNSKIGLTQMRLDLIAALEYTDKNTDLPIVVYGHSAGGYAAASVLNESSVTAAVSVAGFNSTVETMHDKAEEYVGFIADIQLPFLKLQNRLTFKNEGFITACDSINLTDKPIAVYSGSRDTVVTKDLSINSHKKSITNKNAVFYETDDAHSTAWLTDNAEAYIDSLNIQFEKLQNKYSGDIPKKVLNGFYQSIDKNKANELDSSFMNSVLEFFNKAIA